MAAEITQAEVLSGPKTITAWRALLSWLTLFFTHLFSFIALRLPLLSPSPSFKPLPDLELPQLQHPHDSPQQQHHQIRKLTVVLDLDETLVSAYETSSLPASFRNQAIESGLNWFELQCVAFDKDCNGKPKVNHVTVFERPGLQEFLRKISEFADVVLFTAGLESYASPLVDRIDVENRIGIRLYRPSTISTVHREHVKDLACLSRDLSRTVIVDNNPFSFLLQPRNGVPCIPFTAGPHCDEQLLEVLLPLLKHLSVQEDVRDALYDRFHMPEWFQEHGIPASSWTS